MSTQTVMSKFMSRVVDALSNKNKFICIMGNCNSAAAPTRIVYAQHCSAQVLQVILQLNYKLRNLASLLTTFFSNNSRLASTSDNTTDAISDGLY